MSGEEQSGEAAARATPEQPPVLPVSETAAEANPSKTEQMQVAEDESRGGITDLWGFSEKIDNWQVSSMPEDKQYFAVEGNVLDAAISAVKSRLDDARDGNLRNYWLLTEIDHWDLERERLIVLTDKTLISVKYDFIHTRIEELRYVLLSRVSELLYGEFKYPSTYFFNRGGVGLKVTWGSEPMGFFTRWNPLSSSPQYTILASHILVRRGRASNPKLELEGVVPEIEKAIQDIKEAEASKEGATATEATKFTVKEGEIVIDTMWGISAMVHNQSNLGFNKKRGAVDF